MWISTWFLRLAVIVGLIGMVWGVIMGITQDFTLSPAHAHLNLVGWVSMLGYALVYRVIPEAAAGRLPIAHFGLTTVGVAIFIPSLAAKLSGSHALDLGLAIGPLLVVLGMVVFTVIVFRATSIRGDRVGSGALAPAE